MLWERGPPVLLLGGAMVERDLRTSLARSALEK
jgi:hypothetical protein